VKVRGVKGPLGSVLTGTVVLFLLYAFWGYSHFEAVCVFNRWIDTQVSSKYSEENFDKIQPGMQAQETINLLGNPLWKQPKPDSTEEWSFTMDGKCSWGDFAWMGRTVWVSNGVVFAKEKRIYYD
jgi:hypothetical protein